MRSHPLSNLSNLCLLPLLVLLAALSAVAASACTCGISSDFSYVEHRLRFDRAFHGEVIDRGDEPERGLHWMRFRVFKDYSVPSRVWEDTATVWSSLWDASCGVSYPPGRQVLVFADTGSGRSGLPADALSTHLCALNVGPPRLDSVARELEAAVGLRARARNPRSAALGDWTRTGCGPVLFQGKVLANGALRSADGER